MTANQLGPLPHPPHAKMARPFFITPRRVDALAIVSYSHLQLPIVVADCHVDPARACVAKRITQRLAGDPVDIVPEDRVEIARPAFDGDIDDGRTCRWVMNLG